MNDPFIVWQHLLVQKSLINWFMSTYNNSCCIFCLVKCLKYSAISRSHQWNLESPCQVDLMLVKTPCFIYAFVLFLRLRPFCHLDLQYADPFKITEAGLSVGTWRDLHQNLNPNSGFIAFFELYFSVFIFIAFYFFFFLLTESGKIWNLNFFNTRSNIWIIIWTNLWLCYNN